MSQADYSQSAEDHQSLLILVRHTGSRLNSKAFNCVWDRIRRERSVKVPGHDRMVHLRYKRAYSPSSNEWGDFQAHRKVLGLLSIGHCAYRAEFEDLFTKYKDIKGEYASTIFNSRLIAFGLNRDGSPLQEKVSENGDSHKHGNQCPTNFDQSDGNKSTKFTLGVEEDNGNHGNFETGGKHENTESGNFGNGTPATEISNKTSESETIISAENRKDCEKLSSGRSDNKPAMSKGQNSTSTLKNKNKAGDGPSQIEKGRPHSNSLTKDSSGAEVVFYPDVDQCSDLEERLREFAASLFFVLESKRLDRSFERADKMQLLCTPFERKDYVGVDTDTRSFKRRCQGRLRKHLADLSLQAGLPGEAIMHYQTSMDMLKSVNDSLWIGACFEGLSAASVILSFPKAELSPIKRNLSFSVKRGTSLNETKLRTGALTSQSSMPNGVDLLADAKSGGMNPENIIDKYKEAITQYSKYKQAGVIELEASIKACRVLISQQVESYYSTEVGKLEMARYQALATTLHDDQTKLALSAYYDKERTTLVKKMQTMLDNRLGVTSGSVNLARSTSPTFHYRSTVATNTIAPLNLSSDTRPGENLNAARHNTSSEDSDTSVNSADFDDELFIKRESSEASSSSSAEKDAASVISPTDFETTFPEKKCLGNLNTPNMMGFQSHEQCFTGDATTTTLESETNHDRGRKRLFPDDQLTETADLDKPKKRQRQLNNGATNVLTDWYDKNMHYPYPSDQTVEELALSGGITAAQVKKWMANKRVRSYNTLSFSGNAHPIKFKFQKKKKSSREAKKFEAVMQGEDSEKENVDPNHESSGSGSGICKPLQAKARKVLTDWYNTHLFNPYPTDDEKLSLAMQGGITVSQVKSWFANKRSRTNNTRRQVPNYFIKKYPSYLPYIEMISLRRRSTKVKVEPQVMNSSQYPAMQQLSY